MIAAASILRFMELTPAITPIDRMRAIRSLNTGNAGDIPWPALIGSAAVIGLLVLLVAVNRGVAVRKKEKLAAEFDQQADKAGLTAAERRLMAAIARFAGVADDAMVFTDHEAFSRGAARMMQEHFSSGDSIEERRNVKAAIESVYQKLGIVSSAPSSRAVSMSSRQIPSGRQIFMTRAKGDASETIEATVVHNRHDGLVIRPAAKITVTNGEKWHLRYSFGMSTLEFESFVTGFEDGTLTLAHKEMARNTNRRRFLRVPVKARALVANYAFQTNDTSLHKATPKFVNAEIREVAGPGLLIETSLAASEGDKLLLVAIFENGEAIRNIGEVKHVKASSSGYSIALELVALTDEEIGAMVRLTNMAAKQMQEPSMAGGTR
jgi:hypothetical protein